MIPVKTIYHRHIAEYFNSQPLYLDEKEEKKPNIRKLVEQPWQQGKSHQLQDLYETLTNPQFCEAKCVGYPLKVDDLISDFKLAIKLFEINGIEHYLITQLLLSELWSEAPVIRKFPELFIQQIWNRLRWKNNLPSILKERFINLVKSKRSEGIHILIGLVASLQDIETPMQLQSLQEKPVAVVMYSEGLLSIDRYGHWYLINENNIVYKEGQINPKVVNKICINGSSCVILSGSIIALWKKWPNQQPFLFQTGWEITDISLSQNELLLVIGNSGEWVIYNLKEDKPSRLYSGNISKQILIGSISPNGDYWIIQTTERNIMILNKNEIIYNFKLQFLILHVNISFDNTFFYCISTNGEFYIYDFYGNNLFYEHQTKGINHSSFIPDSKTILAITATGDFLKIYEEDKTWKSVILLKVPYYLKWVGKFYNDGPVVLLDDNGVFRLFNFEDNNLNDPKQNSILKNVVGIIPFDNEYAILATVDGKFWTYQIGNDSEMSMIFDNENALIGIYDLFNRNLLVLNHQRSCSYLARINLDEDKFLPRKITSPETSNFNTTTVLWARTSPTGKYVLIGSRSLGIMNNMENKLRLDIYETKSWRKIKEKWLDGWDASVVISDNKTIAVFNNESRDIIKIYDKNNQLEGICPIKGSEPIAFDKDGHRLLLVDGRLNAWICIKPWENQRFLIGKSVKSAHMSANGNYVVLLDKYGVLFLIALDRNNIFDPHILAKFILGWIPKICKLYTDRCEIYLAGISGFQIISWKAI